MKKMLCAIFALVLAFATILPASARGNENTLLSELSDEGCISFLKEYSIQIPYIYENEIECVPFVRAVIRHVENNPGEIIRCKNYILLRFALDIMTAVNAYYGNTKVMTYEVSDSEDIVEDNIVYVAWESEYVTYNCYGFAIDEKMD